MARGAPGFFDVDERLPELSAKGDDLEWVKNLVDFEMFRPALEASQVGVTSTGSTQSVSVTSFP